MGKQNLIGTGWSQNSESAKAGEEAAKMALDEMEPNSSVAWAIAFNGGRHEPGAVLQGLRNKIGEVETENH